MSFVAYRFLFLIVVPVLVAHSAVGVSIPLSVNTASAAWTSLSDSYVCANMDWWPASKCNFGDCPWSDTSVLHVDLSNVLLRNAVSGLSPLHIRIGGSLGDFVVYQQFSDFNFDSKAKPSDSVTSAACDEFDAPTNATICGYPYDSGCLTATRWESVVQFCASAGCSFIFGLNYLYGRTPPPYSCSDNCQWNMPKPQCCRNFTGKWDSSNALQFIQWNEQHNVNIYAYELGNEMDGGGNQERFDANEYAADIHQLRSLIDSVAIKYNSNRKPLVFAADGSGYDTLWDYTFISAAAPSLDGFTYHIYSLGAATLPEVPVKAMDPKSLDEMITVAKRAQDVVTSLPGPTGTGTTQLWMGETGGAALSGYAGVTNTFWGSFWYLDAMAIDARYGHSGFCRQTLIGGNYGLLDYITYLPNPDYYAAQLFAKLMGPSSLVTTLPESTSHSLRAYAHCTNSNLQQNAGAVTVLLLNVNSSTAFSVDLQSIQPAAPQSIRKEWRVQSAIPGVLSSTFVLLNGNKLVVGNDGTFPDVIGQGKEVDMENELTIDPYSYMFVILPTAKAAACMQSLAIA